MRVTGEIKEKMVTVLGDAESQRILSLVVKEPLTTLKVATELGLPVSTVYRKVGQMREAGLLLVDRFVFGADGKREAQYACAFSEIRFKPGAEGLEVEVTFSQKALEKRWIDLLFSRPEERPDWQP